MTAFSKISNGKPRTAGNIKDRWARGPRPRPQDFETAGFTLIEPPSKWSYTWQGVFPVFRVAPGRVNGLAGIVARCDAAGAIEWFPYGTTPKEIKTRLDDLILEIMRREADLAEEPDEIDIDAYMALNEPLWGRSPRIDRTMKEYGISRREAAEIFEERD